MTDLHSPEAPADARNLAEQLAPLICSACDDRLSDLSWFRTDWQRGGAGTARASFVNGAGEQRTALLKVPVGRRELTWLRRLQCPDDEIPAAPRLYASGEECGGYDLAWVVIEFFDHGPLGAQWSPDLMPLLAESAARFHAAASRYPVENPAAPEPWDDLLRDARENIKTNDVSQRTEWSRTLKGASKRLPALISEWNARDDSQWLHGDLHPANAMSRTPLGEGPICLIDLAEVRSGHWVEDAVYLERQFWARRDLLKAMRPVAAIARARKELGLTVEAEYPRLAMIRRVLLAATAPAFLRSEGSANHLDACLNWMHIGMNELK